MVAPWLRGYAPSPIAGPYDLDTLAADALALIHHLCGEVDLVGHDWGGRSRTACAPPRPRTSVARSRSPSSPADLPPLARLPEAVEEELVHAPVPGPRSRRSRARRDLALIDRLWRAWSPSFTLDAARVTSCTPASSEPPRPARVIPRDRPPSHGAPRMRKAEATSRHPCSKSTAATMAACCRPTRTASCSSRASSRSCRTSVTSSTSSSRHDRRARRPLVDVALRVRRVRGTARTGWPGAGSEDSGDAVGIWSLLSLSRCFSGDGAVPG